MRFATERTAGTISADILINTFHIPYIHREAEVGKLPEAIQAKVQETMDRICTLSEEGRWIYIHGGPKTGKSKAAVCLFREALLRQASAWFFPSAGIELDRRMLEPELLVFDDLMRIEKTPVTGIFTLVKARCEDGKITVITSQQPPASWEKSYYDQVKARMTEIRTS